MSENILEINSIEVMYDSVISALHDVSLYVPKGKIVALLGGNGAGKSTTLKSISTMLAAERGKVTKGSIVYDGTEVKNQNPYEMVTLGMVQVLEGRRCFGHLTVEENIIAGAYSRKLSKSQIKDELEKILMLIKERESQGYSYDTAQASFELLARRTLGQLPEFFDVKRYKVTVERRKNKYNKMISLSEAVVVVKVDGQKKLSVSESLDEFGSDRGPVNALAKALAKDLGQYQRFIDDMRLVDIKLRITQRGTEALTRVVIDSEDSTGRRWATVGVSANIVDASFDALIDAMNWKILRDFKSKKKWMLAGGLNINNINEAINITNNIKINTMSLNFQDFQ